MAETFAEKLAKRAGIDTNTIKQVNQYIATSTQKAQDEGDVPNIMFDRKVPVSGPVTGNSVAAYQPEMLTAEDSLKRGKGWYNDDVKRNAVQSDLYRAGFIYNRAGLNNYSGFSGGLENALEAYQMDPARKTETFTEWLHRKGVEGNRDLGEGGGGGTGSGSRTLTALTNEFDAEVLVNNSLNNYLGRDASENEIQEFWKQLNASEKANPVRAAGSYQVGGFNRELAAEKFAEQDEEYADVTANVTLKNLMGDAIRGRLGDTVEGML